MSASCSWRRRRLRPRQRAGHLRAADDDFDPFETVLRPVRLAWSATSNRCGARSSRCRSGSTTRTGSTTRLRPRLPRPPHRPRAARAAISSPSRSPGSSAGRWTAPARCGRSYVIEGLATAAGRCSEVPPRHDRRRVRRDHAEDVHRPDADAPTGRTRRRGRPRRSPRDLGAVRLRDRTTWPATRRRRCASQLGIVRDVAEAAGITSVSAAARRPARPTRRVRSPAVATGTAAVAPAHPRAADAVEQVDHRAPPLRHALGVARQPQAAEGGHRRHAERRRHGGVRRRPARVPHRARRAPGQPAAGDGAGVDPHRQRARSVDEPGVRRSSSICRPTRRPARARRACRAAMDVAKGQFELMPADALVDAAEYSSPVVATSAIRLASRLRLADRITRRST